MTTYERTYKPRARKKYRPNRARAAIRARAYARQNARERYKLARSLAHSLVRCHLRNSTYLFPVSFSPSFSFSQLLHLKPLLFREFPLPRSLSFSLPFRFFRKASLSGRGRLKQSYPRDRPVPRASFQRAIDGIIIYLSTKVEHRARDAVADRHCQGLTVRLTHSRLGG